VDVLGALLEAGLVAVLLGGPLPFGAVRGAGREVLEAACFFLLAIWLLRAARKAPVLPGRGSRIAVAGLLLLALAQAVPAGRPVVGVLSPRSVELRARSIPPPALLEAEERLAGGSPESPPPALSLAPSLTASALRTGAALACLWLVSTSVVRERGARRIAWALLLSAAFQGLYGTLLFASGSQRILGEPKLYYLDAATGTFVNKNHYASFLAAGLASGYGLFLSFLPRRKEAAASSPRSRLVALFEPDGVRALFAALLCLCVLCGLLLSFSRAGIAAGGIAVGLLLLAARGTGARALASLLLLAIAAVPLLQLGFDRFAERFARAGEDLQAAGGRLAVWRDSVRMLAAFPATGSGFGTFAEVYPAFRSPEVRLRYEHAHSDPLEFAAEGGLVGALLAVLLLGAAGRRLYGGLRASRRPLRAGLAAGLFAILLHSLVDFPLHVPAIAALVAILAGALETGEGEKEPDSPPVLRLATVEPRAARFVPILCGAGVLLLAVAANLLGSSEARSAFHPEGLAARAVHSALEGRLDPEPLRELRRRLDARPLDAPTRAVYAAALVAVAQEPAERSAAAWHARRAAELSPASLPVLRGAALVLARAGEAPSAMGLARSAFEFDPAGAAALLEELEREAGPEAPRQALADRPEAWSAWARKLLGSGRFEEAEALLRATVERWPRYLPARRMLAGRALARNDWAALARSVPADLPLAEEPASAPLFALRARVRAWAGDRKGALEDIESALEQNGRDPDVLSLAGDARLALGDVAGARALYRRALYRLAPGDATKQWRAGLLVRLAELEDRHGTADGALRAWREVLREFPELEGARRRLAELEATGR